MEFIRYSIYASRLRWLYLMAAVLIMFGFVSVRAQTAGEGWSVSTVEGAALVIGAAGAEQAATPGQLIGADVTIRTGSDGTVLLVRRGDSITIYPNSELKIPAASAAGDSGVLQDIGRLLYRMETRKSRNFKVRTPFLVTTIKGTTFDVVVERTRATVSVAEGRVRVETTRGGNSADIGAGQRATVSNDDRGAFSITVTEDNSRGRPAKRGKNLTGDDSMGRESKGDDSDNDNSGDDDSGNGDSGGDDSGNGDSGGDDSGNGDSGGDDSGNGDSGGDDSGNGDSGGDDSANGESGGDDSGNGGSRGDDSGNDDSRGDDSGNDDSGDDSSQGDNSGNGKSRGDDSDDEDSQDDDG